MSTATPNLAFVPTRTISFVAQALPAMAKARQRHGHIPPNGTSRKMRAYLAWTKKPCGPNSAEESLTWSNGTFTELSLFPTPTGFAEIINNLTFLDGPASSVDGAIQLSLFLQSGCTSQAPVLNIGGPLLIFDLLYFAAPGLHLRRVRARNQHPPHFFSLCRDSIHLF